MGSRICKKCGISKDFSYLGLNTQSRLVYKDQDSGFIWHGKVCGECFTEYVRDTSGKARLSEQHCACGKSFKQKNIKQRRCSKDCYSLNTSE